jgi:DNA-binding transcriptional regulator YiaG
MNIAAVLKNEISRVARKEVRTETQQLKKSVVHYRTEIAALKRRLAELERAVKRDRKAPGKPAAEIAEGAEKPQRMTFSASGLAAQRKKLGLSANELGALVGVTGQSIYKWEQGKAKPRAAQLMTLRAMRGLGKKAVAARLAELSAG